MTRERGNRGGLVSLFLVSLMVSRGVAQTVSVLVPERVVETRSEWITGTSVVVKTGGGTVWLIPTDATNTYTGTTTILDGVLRAEGGRGLPALSTLYLNGANVATRAAGVYESRGTFARNVGTGAGQIYWNGTYGGFSAFGGDLVVTLNGGADLVWGAVSGFNGKSLSLGSWAADGVVEIQNNIGLGADRVVAVDLNTNNPNNLALFSGIISNGAVSACGLTKQGNGTLWLRNTNTYTGALTLRGGAVRAVDGVGLPAAARLVFGGTYGILESVGTFTRTIGTGAGQVSWSSASGDNGGGFAAWGGPFSVTLNGGAVLSWAAADGLNGRVLALNSLTANDVVTLNNALEMGAARTIYVYDNPFVSTDYARITGDIRGNNTGWNLTKSGPGLLELAGFNSYRGNTLIQEGTLRVTGAIASNNYCQVSAPAVLSGTGLVINAPANGLLCYGMVSPRDAAGAGTLGVTGNATFYTNSGIELALGPSATPGTLAISGNLTIQTNFIIRLLDLGGRCEASDQLTLITYGGTCLSFPTNAWSLDGSLVCHSARWIWTNATLVHDPAGKRIYITGLRMDPPTPDTVLVLKGGVGNWTDENWDGPLPYPDTEAEAQVTAADSDITVAGPQDTHTLTLSDGLVQISEGSSLRSYVADIQGGELRVEGALTGFERLRVRPGGLLRVSGTLSGADVLVEGTNRFDSGALLQVRDWSSSQNQALTNVTVMARAVAVPPALIVGAGSVVSAETWTVRGPAEAVESAQVAGMIRLGADGELTLRGDSAANAVIRFEGGVLRAAEATRVGGLDFTLGGVIRREGATDPLRVTGPLMVQGQSLDLDALKMDTAEATIVATNGFGVTTTGDFQAVSLRMTGSLVQAAGVWSVSNVLSVEDVTITNPIVGNALVMVGESRTRDQLVWLTASNSYRGKTVIERGTFRADPGWGLPDDEGAGALEFSADADGWHAVLEGRGSLSRNVGLGPRGVFWSGRGGFAAWGGDLDVVLSGGNPLTWTATNGFQGFQLYLNSPSATHAVTLHNPIHITANVGLRVFDNIRTNSDVGRLTGTLSMDTAARVLQKVGEGMVWLTGTNTFGGRLQIDDGVVRAVDGIGLPAAAVLYFNGTAAGSRSSGVLESRGMFARTIGTAGGQVYWNNPGGFSAFGAPLQLVLNSGAAITWSAANGFNAKALVAGSPTADDVATLVNPVDLGANRAIYVWDNTNSAVDAFQMAGTIANGGAGTFGLWKYGDGVLWLTGTNTFTGGVTNFNGVVRFEEGVGIPLVSPMRLWGGNVYPCVFESRGPLTRNLGTANGEISWSGSGGFSAWGGDLDLLLQGGAELIWSSLTGGFNGQVLHLGSRSANGRVTLANAIQLNGNRSLYVWDNLFATTDVARISGRIANGGTANSQLLRYGDGLLELTATNAYTGATSLYDGDTRVLGVISGGVVVAVNHTNGPRTTLSGSGTVGTLTVNANGVVAPGNGAVGTLTVNGTATFLRGSAIEWEIGPFNQCDRLHVVSNLTLNAEWVVRVRDAGGTPSAEDRLPMITFDGFLASNTTAVLDASLLDDEVWDLSQATVYYDPTNKQVGLTGLACTGPRVEVSDAIVRETDEGTAEAVFRATLLDGFMGDVDLYFTTADGTAQAASDYTATSGMVTLTMDWPTAEISVRVHGDTVPEWPSEYFWLTLAVTGGNARLVISAARGSIVDDDGALPYKMPITFSGYSGSETLTNFPALITFREGVQGFSYGMMGHTNGWDLRFLDADETGELAYEIERWDRNGTSYVWVRLPELKGTNTRIWAVWGDSTVTEPPAYSTNGTVWSDGYLTVHHFNPPSGGFYRDSSPKANHGVNEGGRISGGAIGAGLDLLGATNNVNLTGMSSTEQSYTFEMWVRSPSLTLNQYLFDAQSGRHLISFNQMTLGSVSYYDTTWRSFPFQALNNGAWQHLTVVADRDAARVALYVNGTFLGTNTYAPRGLGGQIRLGSLYNAPATQHYDGQMDEFRVSTRARSRDWIAANYWAQNAPDIFARKGAVVTADGAPLADAPLAVGNRPATAVGDGKATLNGVLIGTGGGPTAGLIVCWGTTDGGTGSTGDWAYAQEVGTDFGPSAWVSVGVSNLSAGQSYAFRFLATNASGMAWASPAEWLTMSRGWYVATTGDGTDGQSWATAYTNIQTALNAAQPGDTLFLKGERFDICDDPARLTQLIVTTAAIRIRGGYLGVGTPGSNDPTLWPTIITRSAGTNRLMLIDGADNVELFGLWFTNGYARSAVFPAHPDSSGAGLFIRNANGIRIERCVFFRNWGYGPFVNGGYVYGGGLCVSNSRVEILKSQIVSNLVTSLSSANLQHGSGGGLALLGGEVTLEDVEITANWIAGDYIHGYVDGGGLSIRNGILMARRVVIGRNDVGKPSHDGRQWGDGLYLSGAGRIENGLFFRNGLYGPTQSGSSNFAVYVAGGYLTLDRVTVSDHRQAGVYRIGGSVVISNSVFWNNNGVDVYENVAGNVIPYFTLTQQGFYDGVNGCFSADPRFADTNFFHLKSRTGTYRGGYFSGGTWQNDDDDSPAIDAGDPLFRVDLEPFPNGGRLNLGAYGGTEVASKSPPLAVTNDPATAIAPTGARLNGRLLAIGGYGTEAWFLWDTEDREDDEEAWSNRTYAGTFDAAGPVWVNLTGLIPETVYYYRLMATNPAGGYALASPSESFMTVLGKPDVENRGVENESGPEVLLKGEVTLTGGEDPQVYVCWGEIPGGKTTGSWDRVVPVGVQDGAFSVVVTTQPGRTHYYTCAAINSGGEGWAWPPVQFGASNLFYVAGDAAGEGTGQGWANAFSNLQDALNAIQPGKPTEIYLKGGSGSALQAAGATLWTHSNARLLGGYEGSGWPGPRDPDLWPTVLTRRPANAIRILSIVGVTNGLLDGVTVSGGNLADFGGGIRVENSTNLTVSNCRIIRNKAENVTGGTTGGGGLFALNSFGTIERCLFERNAVTNTTANGFALGGGLMISNGQWRIRNTQFIYNTANAGGSGARGRGAGLYVHGGQHEVRNCLFAQNYPCGQSDLANFAQGGAAYLTNTAVAFAYVTVAGNVHEGIHGAQFASIRHSILWHNGRDLVGTPAVLSTNSISDGDGAGNDGNVVADPLFEYGFYLGAASACRDAAAETASEAGLENGTTRADGLPDDGMADLGYHHPVGIGPWHHLYVAPTGNDGNAGTNATSPLRSLTRALDRAVVGTRILVAEGRYDRTVETFPLVVDKAGVWIVGTNTEATVISSLNATSRVFHIFEAPWVVLREITVADGLQPTYRYYQQGGGLWIRHSTDLLLDRCLIARNANIGAVNEVRYGGGIYAENAPFARALSTRFVSNNVTAGSNAWDGQGDGGGLYLLRGSWTFDRCVFIANQARGYNNAGSRGGAVAILGGAHEFRNSLIVSNSLEFRGYGGDAIYSQNATTRIVNVTVADNGWHPSKPAGFLRDALRQVGAGLFEVRNSIVYNNQTNDLAGFTTNASGELVNVSYSCIGDGQNNGVQGCFQADPLFTEHPWYHLASRKGYYQGGYWDGGVWTTAAETSPCIDAGDPNDPYDLEPEPNGKRINLGAYGNTETASLSYRPGGTLIIIR